MLIKLRIGACYECYYFFIMIIYMAMATPYTQALSFPPYKSILSFFIPIILTIFLVYRNIKAFKLNRSILNFTIVFLLWFFFQYLKFGEIYPMSIFLIYNVLMAYIFVSVYGYRIFILYEQSITILALISLIFWGIYNLNPILVETFLIPFNLIEGSDTAKANILIYGVATTSDILGVRNLGFAQEPGFYSSFLIVAIYFNLILNKFVILGNNNFFILFLALITTQSTTGYLSLLPVILLYFFQKSTLSKSFIFIAVGILIPIIFSLPFIGKKLNTYMYSESSIETAANSSEFQSDINSVYVPQRIDGAVFEWLNLLYDPILGYGVESRKNSFVATHIGDAIYIANGNIKIFSKFGFLIGIFYLIGVYKSGRLLLPFSPNVGGICFLLMFLVLGFSYDMIHIPLLLSIWLFSYLKTDYVPVREKYIRYVSRKSIVKM